MPYPKNGDKCMSPRNIGVCEAGEGGHHALCGCGNQPPIHCMWCCEDLTSEEIKACLDRGDTIKAAVLDAQGLHELVCVNRKSAT
jgi:hypothetical protein